jgi:hypothetical protein
LLFPIWLCVPLGILALKELSEPVQTGLYLTLLVVGYLVLDLFRQPGSPHPEMSTLAYAAVLGTVIFNSK